jgi:hypothetical protein
MTNEAPMYLVMGSSISPKNSPKFQGSTPEATPHSSTCRAENATRFERDASLLLHMMSNPPPPAPVPDDELDEVLLHCISHSPSSEITIILIHGACVSGQNRNPIVTCKPNRCRTTWLILYPKIENIKILPRSFLDWMLV